MIKGPGRNWIFSAAPPLEIEQGRGWPNMWVNLDLNVESRPVSMRRIGQARPGIRADDVAPWVELLSP